MDSSVHRRKPRLERRNAAKNFDYDPSLVSSSTEDSPSPSSLRTRSLELNDQTSFRVEGNDGEFDRICRSLGLSIDDFAIPVAAWQASKIRSSSDITPRSRLNRLSSPNKKESEGVPAELKQSEPTELAKTSEPLVVSEVRSRDHYRDRERDQGTDRVGIREVTVSTPNLLPEPIRSKVTTKESIGIKGVRPPVLKAPPSKNPPVIDNVSSTWDIYRGFGPDDDRNQPSSVILSYFDEEDVKDVEQVVERPREKATEAVEEQDLFTTSNDDDTSSSTTEPTNISPNGRIKRTITYWEKGGLLGSGSFGSVYEGIAEDGFFFAVKEVSLLNQGDQGKESIIQLEQEIALLSQFEHENIVQYYGTDK
ncbi:hypothetical protein CRG98_050296, partial [Punica granatum]